MNEKTETAVYAAAFAQALSEYAKYFPQDRDLAKVADQTGKKAVRLWKLISSED